MFFLIIYFFRFKLNFFYYFFLIAEEQSRRLCFISLLIWRTMLPALFMKKIQRILFPCVMSKTFGPHIFVQCLILLLVLCMRCSFWLWTSIIITTAILIVLILSTIFVTNTGSTTRWKNTRIVETNLGVVTVCLL